MSDGTIGEHWLESALSRIRAGEPEIAVMLDYGYEATAPADGCGSRSPVTGCPCELPKGHGGVHRFQEVQ
jgi:hypothetical protein